MDSSEPKLAVVVNCKECLQSIILFITFIVPYEILILPSCVLGLESYKSKFLFALAVLASIVIFGNLYYVFSLALQYFISCYYPSAEQSPLGHN